MNPYKPDPEDDALWRQAQDDQIGSLIVLCLTIGFMLGYIFGLCVQLLVTHV
jgi:hypothetical protein